MRYLYCLIALLLHALTATAQREDLGWIAPEGKIINYRTLNWNDFQGKEDKDFAEELGQRNLQAAAYVCPAIYFSADSGEQMDNGRYKFKFHVKCAFQSRAFVRESTKQRHSNYVLIHEQDHYDIALNYANKLQRDLSSRDYSANYNDEIEKIYNDLYKAYHKVQETYDREVNPDGREEVAAQRLWDMRIKKCLENNTDEFYGSPESVVKTVKEWGQTVKRIPGEGARQFVVRARPIYTEFTEELSKHVVETTEWSQQPALLAFYMQKYYVEEDGATTKDYFRTLAYLFVPNGKDTYKRIMIDTLGVDNAPMKINAVFFANADSDNVKELVIQSSVSRRSGGMNGTHYYTRVYDNIPARALPARLRRLNEVSQKLDGGFEGTMDGKAQKASYKTEQELTGALLKMGFANPPEVKKQTIHE